MVKKSQRSNRADNVPTRNDHSRKISHKNKQVDKKVRIKPKTMEEYRDAIRSQESSIKNKMKRVEVHLKRKALKNQIKTKARKERKKLPTSERQTPVTIEDKQIGGDEYGQEYEQGMFDEFEKILSHDAPVKVLITTAIRPATKTYDFLREIMMVFHNIAFYPRCGMSLDEVYLHAKNLDYSHVMVLRYSHGWELLIRHLEGILAVFKITSLDLQKDIRHHAISSEHMPELILNNFDSKVGVRVGRLLASLFPQNPQFQGRRVVTFHNQRDFIFFRHHRYIFSEEFSKVDMQQIGPRFTLRLKKIYAGNKEEVKGLQFEAKDNMYVQRTAVYL